VRMEGCEEDGGGGGGGCDVRGMGCEEDGSDRCGAFHMMRGNVNVNCASASGSGERSKPVACSKIAS